MKHYLYYTWYMLLYNHKNDVSPLWQESFDNFLADMGDRPDKHTLRRIDKSKPFGPGNCEWREGLQPRKPKELTRWSNPAASYGTRLYWAERNGKLKVARRKGLIGT